MSSRSSSLKARRSSRVMMFAAISLSDDDGSKESCAAF